MNKVSIINLSILKLGDLLSTRTDTVVHVGVLLRILPCTFPEANFCWKYM